MIRIVRAPEPSALPPERAARLSAARAALAAGEKVVFKGHEIVKDDLFRMQHHKCCYCEKLSEQAKFRDVEHFRPKARYWWLAWTWENLLFACIDCNREYKREQFPLAPGSTALVAEQAPPGKEVAQLIDPAASASDPLHEIVFRRETTQSREQWMPVGLSDRGRETVRVCGLDRPGLLTLYATHVRDVVRPKIELFRITAADGADTRAVFAAWGTLLRSLLGPAREFRALSRDALAVLVDPGLRERHGLRLPRPA